VVPLSGSAQQPGMNKKRIFRWAIGVALVAVACVGGYVVCIFYANWSAERSAREFCSMIPIGSDIAAATVRATEKNILWGSDNGYTFYFSGFIFDKAVCQVSVSKEGKVISRIAETEYD
jgi:hypothetical protein